MKTATFDGCQFNRVDLSKIEFSNCQFTDCILQVQMCH